MNRNSTQPKALLRVTLALATAFLGIAPFALAQTAITSAQINTVAATSGNSYTATKAPNGATTLSHTGSYTYTFGNATSFIDNAKTLRAFTAGGAGYTYNTGIPISIKLRRVENSAMTSYRTTYGVSASVPLPTPRDLAYYEGLVDNTKGTVQIKSTYIPKMEDLFLTNDLTIGIDNLFANTTATNFNNIERIDVVASGGITVTVPGAQGFALFERGIYNAHDPVTVALITGVNGSGDPTSYTNKVVHIVTADYNASGQTTNGVYQPTSTATGNFIILRRDSPDEVLRASDLIGANQGIGGVLLKYSDFNIAAGATVYGYSVMAADFPTSATGANAVDYTNTTYFPTNSSDATGAAGNDMATITGVVKILNISGNVYHDANGLTDNVIIGPGINNPSNTQPYVNLVNASNTVVGIAQVQTDGSFTFDKLAFGPLTAQLSLNQGTLGSPAPAIALPTGWANIGEAFGLNNNSGSGNESAVQANGSIGVTIGDVNLTNIIFGIEQRPQVSAGTDSPRLNPMGTIPSPVSSTLFTGTDPEDGSYTPNLLGRTVILTPASNGTLYYNNSPISSSLTITNFIPTQVSLDPSATGATTGSGGASPDPSFSYAVSDNAGMLSDPKFIAVPFTVALPVSLVSFTAQVQADRSVRLNWTTSWERSNTAFTIERSKDLKRFEAVGQVTDVAGSSNSLNVYQFVDKNPYRGLSYYRLAQVDVDGSIHLFKAESVEIEGRYGVYPNPVVSQRSTLHVDEPTTAIVHLYNAVGAELGLSKAALGEGSMSLTSLSKLVTGIYLLTVEERGGLRKHRIMVE